MEYTSKARKLLKQHGNEKIKKVFLIKTFNNKIIKYSSLALFKKKYKHVKLFHIELKLITASGVTLFLEKSFQVKLNYKKTVPIGKEVELQLPEDVSLSLNQLLKNTKKYMGKRFGRYRVLNNCQHFVDSFLKANSLEKPSEEEVRQELEHYLDGSWFFVKWFDAVFFILDFVLMLYFSVLYRVLPSLHIPYCLFWDARTLYFSCISF
jgi:hypothetical protein